MREILFRGKRMSDCAKSARKWVDGNLEYNHVTEITFIRTPRNIYVSVEMVDPATVGQYTGLTDKNGVKIFDGDVVRVCLNPEICVGTVEFDERVGAFIIKFPENKCISFLDLYVARNKRPGLIWTEVIGNIHDNPELLEGEK